MRALSGWIALASIGVAAGCRCPTLAGPTAPTFTVSATLAPGETRAYDVPTPDGTTQVNLRVSWIVGLSVWQVPASCALADVDHCPRLAGATPLTGPPQTETIGLTGLVVGATARFVVRNTLRDVTMTVALTIEPWRAGCT